MEQVCKNCRHYWGDACVVDGISRRVYDPHLFMCDFFQGEKTSKDNRGGARPGAGRKSKEPEEKRMQITISVHRDTRDKLNAISRAKGISPGRVVDEMVKDEW